MKSVDIFTSIHFNLNFSSLPHEYIPNLLKYCYVPIINVVKKLKGLRLGIEMPAKTLESIYNYDKNLIKDILLLVAKNKLEFIASGYEQMIGPLVPYKINKINLSFGNHIYQKILGFVPKIAYINEQIYADSLVELYRKFNFSAIIVDIDSVPEALSTNPEVNKYCPLIGQNTKESIYALWNSSIAFQKLQRYIRGEITYYEYEYFLNQQHRKSNYLCLYGGDAEMIGFKPYGLDSLFHPQSYKKTFLLFERLLNKILAKKQFEFKLPSEVVNTYKSKSFFRLCNSENPVLSKKQEKYNLSRWALSGMTNVFLNSHAYANFKNTKTSLELWASDYRTFTSNQKYQNFFRLLKDSTTHSDFVKGALLKKYSPTDKVFFKTDYVNLSIFKNKGGAIKSLTFPKISDKPVIGTVAHGYYKEIRLNPDWYSNHSIIYNTERTKITDLNLSTIYFLETKTDILILVKTKLDYHDLYKKIEISKEKEKVRLSFYYFFQNLKAYSLRSPIFTILPSGWDLKTIEYRTHYGTNKLISYPLNGSKLLMDEAVSQEVSSHGCLTTSKNILIISDHKKKIKFQVNEPYLLTKPLIHFENTQRNEFYCRIYFSLAESDETAHHFFRGFLKQSLTISCEEN